MTNAGIEGAMQVFGLGLVAFLVGLGGHAAANPPGQELESEGFERTPFVRAGFSLGVGEVSIAGQRFEGFEQVQKRGDIDDSATVVTSSGTLGLHVSRALYVGGAFAFGAGFFGARGDSDPRVTPGSLSVWQLNVVVGMAVPIDTWELCAELRPGYRVTGLTSKNQMRLDQDGVQNSAWHHGAVLGSRLLLVKNFAQVLQAGVGFSIDALRPTRDLQFLASLAVVIDR